MGFTEKECRQCLGSERPQSMIAPCKCNGSVKWVHLDCLGDWQDGRSDEQSKTCPQCNGKYNFFGNSIDRSMRFSQQRYWSGLPFPFPEDLPDTGIEPRSTCIAGDTLSSEPLGKLVVGYLISGSRICPLVGS